MQVCQRLLKALNALVLWARHCIWFWNRWDWLRETQENIWECITNRAEKKRWEKHKVLTLEDKKNCKELINAVLGYKANFNTIFKWEKSALSFDNDERRHLLRQFLMRDSFVWGTLKAHIQYILMDIIEDANGKNVSYSMVISGKYGEDLKKELFKRPRKGSIAQQSIPNSLEGESVMTPLSEGSR